MTSSRPSAPRNTGKAVGRAATGSPGQGNDTDGSSDWLAERAYDSAADHAPPGVGTPIDTSSRPTKANTGQESGRGKHRSG